MADPIQEIVRNLSINFKIDGAEARKMAESIVKSVNRAGFEMKTASGEAKALGSSLSYMGKEATDANKLMGTLGGSVGFVAGAMSNLSSAATLVGTALGGAAVMQAVRETKQYYSVLLSTTHQFKAYGSNIGEVRLKMKELHDEFGFTNVQSLNLMKTLNKTFAYAPLSEMVKQARFLSDAVGGDVDEMQSLAAAIANASTRMAGLQQIMKRTEKGGFSKKDAASIQSSAIGLAFSGKISASEMKEMFALSRAGSKRAGAGLAEEKQAKSYIEDANRPEQFINDATIALGKKFTAELSAAAGVIKNHGEMLTNVTSTLGKFAAYLGTAMIVGKGLVAVGQVGGFLNTLTKPGNAGKLGGGGVAGGVIGGLMGGLGGRPMPVYVVNLPGMGNGTGGFDNFLETYKNVGQAANQAGGPPGFRGKMNGWFNPGAKGPGGFIGRGGIGGKIGLGGAGAGMLGGALGGLAGWGAEEGVSALKIGDGNSWLGKTADIIGLGSKAEDGSMLGGIGGMGASLGVGLATGGPIGAILALVGNTSNNLSKCFSIWQDIRNIEAETKVEQKRQESVSSKAISDMEAKGAPKIEIELQKKVEKVRKLDEELSSKRGMFSGWFGAESEKEKELKSAQAELQAFRRQVGKARENNTDVKEYWDKQKTELDAEAKKRLQINDISEDNLELTSEAQNIALDLKGVQESLVSIAERYNELLSASTSHFQAQLSMTTALANGPSRSLSDAFSDYMDSISASNSLLNAQIDLLGTIISEAKKSGNIVGGSAEDIAASSKRISDAMASGDRLKMNNVLADESRTAHGIAAIMAVQKQLGATLLQQTLQRAQAADDLLKIHDMELSMQQAVVDQGEIQIQMADNLAMGVAASAYQRMEQARRLGEYQDILNQKRLQAEKNVTYFVEEQKRLKAENASKNAIEEAIAGEKKARLSVLQVTNDMLRTDLKRLEITRTLRDGWISALNAMSNGVGMFEKIKIDKDKRLGTLMAYQPKSVVGIATGFAGAGRRESTSFSSQGVGVLTNPEKSGEMFGAGSREWAKAMDKRSPLGFLGTQGFDINNPAFGMRLWQELQGSKISTNLAGATATPFGVSELVEAAKRAAEGIKDSVREIKKPTEPSGQIPSLNTDVGSRSSGSLSSKQMEEFKGEVLESMIKAFRGICEAAMTRVMDDLQKGR